MTRALLTLACLLALHAPVYAAGTIHTSAKTAIAALKGCVTTAPCEYLDKQFVRVMLLSGYTPDAADEFSDVQAFEIADDEYYISDYGSPQRVKITNRSTSGSIFRGTHAFWPKLASVTFDGIALFVYSQTCTPMATCRSGGDHQIIATWSLSQQTITNQPLILDWNGEGTAGNSLTGEILDYSDANSANWTTSDPLVIAVSETTVALADCSGCTLSDLSQSVTSGTINQWRKYTPTNAGGVTLASASMSSSLRYVVFDGVNLEGFGSWNVSGASFVGLRNFKVLSSLNTATGDIQFGYGCRSGGSLITDCIPRGNEDVDNADGSQWPNGGLEGFTGANTFLVNGETGGYYGGPSFTGESHFNYDVLFRGTYNGPRMSCEYCVMFRSALYGAPNHAGNIEASPSREATVHVYDYAMTGGTQDWLTGDSRQGTDGAEELFVQHSVFVNPKKPLLIDVNTIRANRVRQRLVFVDNAVSLTKDARVVGQINSAVYAGGQALVEHNVFKYYNDNHSDIISVWSTVGENLAPIDSVQSNFPTLTGPSGALAKVCAQFAALESKSVGASIRVAPGTRKQSGYPTTNSGTMTAELRAGACNAGGTIIGSSTREASAFSTGAGLSNAMPLMVLSAAITEGEQYSLHFYGDADYGTTVAGGKAILLATTTFGDTDGWVYNGGTASWSAASFEWAFTVAEEENLFTAAEWATATSQGAGAAANTIADPLFVTTPTYTNGPTSTNGGCFESDNVTFTVRCPSLPNPGTYANNWGANVRADSLGEVRSWFQPDTGSPLLNAASDGTNIGLSDGVSTPNDPGDPPNQAPNNVNAGVDATVEQAGTTNITCTATDDTTTQGNLVFAWTKPSCTIGTIASASAASTTVTWSGTGTCTLRCTVTDDDASPLSAFDEVVYTVQNTAVDNPPTVNAGTDITMSARSCVTLAPTVTDDGLAGAFTVQWSVTGGPGAYGSSTYSFSAATTQTSQWCPNGVGTYTLQLSADDTSNDPVTDTVVVTVQTPATVRRYRLRR